MCRAIRKKVTDGNLMDGVRAVYQAGWNRLKLYFMSGFPGERPDDIAAIYQLCMEISVERSRMGLGPPGDVTASVGWLVPKPFTPLQWMAQPREQYFQAVRNTLRGISKGHIPISGSFGGADTEAELDREGDDRSASRDRRGDRGGRRGPKGKVSIKTHDPERSVLEGVFARGDRRLCAAVEAAWRNGSRFDAWDEAYNGDHWRKAWEQTGIDWSWYAHRERSNDERLPWEHIGLHMRREFLEKAYDDMYNTIGVAKPAHTPASVPLRVIGG